MGVDWSTPTHGPLRSIQGVPRSGENRAISVKAGTSGLNPGEPVRVSSNLYHSWKIGTMAHWNVSFGSDYIRFSWVSALTSCLLAKDLKVTRFSWTPIYHVLDSLCIQGLLVMNAEFHHDQALVMFIIMTEIELFFFWKRTFIEIEHLLI